MLFNFVKGVEKMSFDDPRDQAAYDKGFSDGQTDNMVSDIFTDLLWATGMAVFGFAMRRIINGVNDNYSKDNDSFFLDHQED